ncbi:MAG: transposase [Hydrogenobacter thermophilus]|uniref:RNA-guided endonuclease InsQ/TnpB family protein n=1 Tax=Hydrogenobacter thermophilus TaxID=940 RepID=UPI001C752B3D|nr:transposase [Hydrogenobacter thermophilus]QWK20503.1 MAG: transposase [Hydrogenobacter thermophilus]
MPFRAIEVKHFANKGKVQKIKALFPHVRKTARKIASYQWHVFFKKGSFSRKANIKHIKSTLSERYKYTIQYHIVVPVLESFLSNVQNRFEEIVLNSSLPEKTKKVLLYLCSRKEFLHRKSNRAVWIKVKDGEVLKEELEITEEERHLAKKIFKHILKRWNRPRFSKVQLVLDAKCGKIEKSRTDTFDYWIRVSTLEKGNPVYVPVSLHEYFEKREGSLTQVVQITEEGEGIKVRLVKDVFQREYEGKGAIALDFGMNILFATDGGDLMGREFYRRVEEYAKKIDELERNLKRQGIKPSKSRRYRRLQERLRAYVKNEVRRVLNRIVELYKPETIVVENLRGFLKEVINRFSKSVKRVLMRFGLGELRRKLKELEEDYGVEVVEVNPAYSSQACSCCGYVDKENRKTREGFECKVCGRKLHADVNGSLNLRERFLEGWGRSHCEKEQALRRQVEKFLENLFSERYKCLWSKARGLLTQNPYFLKVLGDSPKPEVWTSVYLRDTCPC